MFLTKSLKTCWPLPRFDTTNLIYIVRVWLINIKQSSKLNLGKDIYIYEFRINLSLAQLDIFFQVLKLFFG